MTIAIPATPGRYEAAVFPLSRGYDAYVVVEDGAVFLEETLPDRVELVPFDVTPTYLESIGPWTLLERAPRRVPLIGLTGKKRTGKNTAAKHLQRFGFEEAAFADPLRDMALAVDPIVGFMPDSRVAGGGHPVYYSDALARWGYERAKELFPEFRRFLQRLGTEGVRETLGAKYGLRDIIGDDVWIVLAEHRIDASTAPIVFTDVRFPNEASLIERKGGHVVRIARPGLPAPTDEHPSETALDDYVAPYTVENDGTPKGLSAAIDTLIDTLP